MGSEASMGVKLLLAQFRWFAPLPRWASQLVQEVGRQIEADPMNTVDLYSLGQLNGMEKGSHPAVPSPDIASVCGSPLNRHQWQVANQFSPLNNVGREGDPWLPPLLPPPPPQNPYHSANILTSSAPLITTASQPVTSSIPRIFSITVPITFWFFAIPPYMSSFYFFTDHPTFLYPTVTTTFFASTNHYHFTFSSSQHCASS